MAQVYMDAAGRLDVPECIVIEYEKTLPGNPGRFGVRAVDVAPNSGGAQKRSREGPLQNGLSARFTHITGSAQNRPFMAG
jgi:hypothetical protein